MDIYYGQILNERQRQTYRDKRETDKYTENRERKRDKHLQLSRERKIDRQEIRERKKNGKLAKN